MKTEYIISALEEAYTQLGLDVRREQGQFRGGRCTVNGKDIIVLNKHHPSESQLAVLAESLRGLPIDTIFMRPAVRETVEKLWKSREREHDFDES